MPLVPLLAAIVLTYGLVVDPQEVAKHMQAITAMVTHGAAKLIDEQLKKVILTATGKKGLGLALALVLWQMPAGATLRDVLLLVQADEAHYRDATTTLLPP